MEWTPLEQDAEPQQPGAVHEGTPSGAPPVEEVEDAAPDIYVRPFVPPPEALPDALDQHAQQPSTPDYVLKYTITGHRMNVSCIRFSPDGQWLITAGACWHDRSGFCHDTFQLTDEHERYLPYVV